MFSIYSILQAALGLGVYSASNRNEGKKIIIIIIIIILLLGSGARSVLRADNLAAICEPIV
jgi:hypothetical protein